MPGFIFLMPNYLMMDRLGWLDTLLALIVPGAAGAFGVFFLRQFFLAIPRELEESALIDGANTWQILTRIMLPISKPALVTLGVLVVPGELERLHLAGLRAVLTRTADAAGRSCDPAGGLQHRLSGGHGRRDHRGRAGLILYIFVQRYVIEGVATSGLKG